ncbi:unnamed protein product [Rotaria sp. Silwood2]|nr:unnamed protein product [Rotaria sp. Silwood2]
MSSITIIPQPTTYATTTANNLPNINLPPMRPLYLQPYAPQQQQPPTYHHLKQQIQPKPMLYGSNHRKQNYLHKFQTGTTTTFNGYTNFSGTRTTNLPPPPPPRTIYHHNPYHNNYNNRYYHHRHHYNSNFNNTQNLPSLLDLNPFHLPPRHNTRTFTTAQHYHPNHHQQHYPRSLSRSRFHVLSQLPSKSRSRSRSYQRPLPPPIKPRRIHHQQQQQQFNRHRYQQQQQRPTIPPYNNTNNNINNNNNNYNGIKRTLQGIILSDSMCSRLRTYAIKKLPLYDIELSYESGCDIYKMIQWLNTPEGRGTVGNKDFLLFGLGTNDVGRYGVDVSLQRVSELISFVRQSYPGNRAIGWLALSPRWKPTRFVSAANIGQMHNQFNERLRILSKQLDFDVVDARLGLADMRVEDGLHPSNTTGKWKYEGATREWFSSRAAAHYSIFFQRRRFPSRSTAPTTPTTTTTLYNDNNINNYNMNMQRQYQPRPNNNYYYQQQQNRIS